MPAELQSSRHTDPASFLGLGPIAAVFCMKQGLPDLVSDTFGIAAANGVVKPRNM